MAYLVAVAIIALFLTAYFVFKPKIREEYSQVLSNKEFQSASKDFVKSLPLPKKSGGNVNADVYVTAIKSALRTLKRKRYREKFAEIIKFESGILALAKTDFSKLQDLASIDKLPRVVKIADFYLKSSNYKFFGERIANVINAQNEIRTLSFDEVESLSQAFLFCALKKIAFLLLDCKTVCKMMDVARKYSANKIEFDDSKIVKSLKNSRLFLSLCAEYSCFDSEECEERKRAYFEKMQENFENVFILIKNIERIDFTVFYAPLRILCKYESFDDSTKEERIGFLNLIKDICDKENLDDYLFAIRLDNYINTASGGHINVLRHSLFSFKVSLIVAKKSITTLAAALSSKTMMALIFGGNDKSKSDKSIIKNTKIENTFEKIGRYKTLNFGISVQNDRLRVKPVLPAKIESAAIKLCHNGVTHDILIERGKEKELYLDDTKLSGTSEIYLKEKPISVRVVLPS